MSKSLKRRITRIALVQDYENRPEKLLDVLDEVAAKGYDGVDTWMWEMDIDPVAAFCARAHALELTVGVATSYMIGQHKYISEHPQQRFVEAVPGVDVDGLGTDSWGCPFNPDFKARYFTQLRKVASVPGMARILVNDEASMSNGCYCDLCLAEYEKQFHGDMPRLIDPKEDDWQDESWRKFLKWRIDRWNAIHGEMAEAVHAVNPSILVGFQTSPGVDMSRNPWNSAVDLHGMAQQLDCISVDPYYTSHQPVGFMPLETYLSEWCRFCKGIVPDGKLAEIVVQGFSHPNFTRPLNEADGYWSSLVPPACGIDIIMPYSYTLQRCSPVQKPYKQCFAFDSYFERTDPIKHAAVVHGIQSEIYAYPMPRDVMGSYDGTRMFPVAESLRHHGLPYGYLPDARLDDKELLSKYKVVVLPQIDCLSQNQAAGLQSFAANGGNLVIVGNLGVSDEIGSPRDESVLEQLTGIRITAQHKDDRRVEFRAGLAAADRVPTVDEIPAQYSEGSFTPVSRLNHCVDIEAPVDADVLACFADDDGSITDQPAVVSVKRGGNIIFFAGFPSRAAINPQLGSEVRNTTHHWFAALTEQASGSKPALRVENWPPQVPIAKLRPVDRRNMSTFEFFPLTGDDIFLALVTSYFREPTSFPVVLDVPYGRQLEQVRELLSGQNIPFTCDASTASIDVKMGFDTPAKLFVFEIA